MKFNYYKSQLTTWLIIALLFVISSDIYCQDHSVKVDQISFSMLFQNIDQNLIGSFTHNYGINHIIAASASYGLVNSGIDWKLRTYLKENDAIAYGGFPSVMLGGLTPLVVPFGLYYYGKTHNRDDLRITALALGQAAILGLTVSSLYKTVTGRRPPDILDSDSDNDPDPNGDFSGDFKYGFMNRGIFDGWPSGHTTTAFAMATTLMELYPDSKSVKACSLIYASLVGLGVSTNIHWFSDAVAGALIGYSIGKSVGRSFREVKSEHAVRVNFGYELFPLKGVISVRF